MRQGALNNTSSKGDHLLSIIWLFLLIIPNGMFLYIFAPLSFILLIDRNAISKSKSLTIIILLISISFLISCIFAVNETFVAGRDYLRVVSLFLYFVIFTIMRGTRILKPYIIIAIALLFTSQLIFLFNIQPLMYLFFNIYPPTEEYMSNGIIDSLLNVDIKSIESYRLGGMFYNPNNFASFMELILITLLCETKQFKKSWLLIFIGIIAVSIILTGSRTALIVFAAIILAYLYLSKILSARKIIIYSILFLVVLGLLDVSSLRAFKINEGLEDSLGTKLGILNMYLSNTYGLGEILFGNLSGQVLVDKYKVSFSGTDFDLGNILVYYGAVFYVLLISLYVTLFRKYDSKYKVVFVLLLWMFSNSILLSYRMAPLWFLVLGLYYRRSISEKSNYE